MNAARGAALGALVLAVAVVAVLLLRGDGGTHLQAALRERRPARQGRRRAGRRPAHRLDPQDQAHRRQPGRDHDLGAGRLRAAARGHDGARSAATSLSGIANRYIALTPGPNSNPKLPDGATLGTDKTTSIVDLDQLFNTLDPKTRKALQQFIQGSAQWYDNRGVEANAATKYFNPALSASRRLVNELVADQQTLNAFLRNAAKTHRRAGLAPRRPRQPRLQRQHDGGGDRRRERVVQPGAGAAARHAAQGQHDVRQPARDARRPRRARRGLQAGDQGPRALPEPAAPARAATRARRSPTCARSCTARAPTTTSPTCCARRPRSSAPPSRRSRTRSRRCRRPRRCSSSSGPTRRTSSAGCATSARARRTTTPTATSPASSRSSTPTRSPTTRPAATLTPIPPSQRLDGLQTGQVRRCPGAASPAAGRRLGALPRHRRLPGLRPEPRAPRPMKRLLAIAGVLVAAAALVVFGTGASDDGGALPRPRDLHERLLGDPGRGRQDRRRQGRQDRVARRHARPQGRGRPAHRPSPASTTSARDAECTIRPQSLIGEKFVECTPTQPRPEDAQPAPKLRKIERGDGQGPVPAAGRADAPSRSTSTWSTTRCACPTASACRSSSTSWAPAWPAAAATCARRSRNANPALKETDKVLEILADQNRVLANLARDGDTILAPLARDRAQGGRLRHAGQHDERRPRPSARATSRRTSPSCRPSCAS